MSSNLPRIKPADFLRVIKNNSRVLREVKKVDPVERYVLLYPNSDNAYVGMGFDLLGSQPAEDTYKVANNFLNKDLFRLCLDGPKSELLGSLENRHLATYVTSHALMAKLACDFSHMIPRCKAAGGVGVGFVNSLVFSGAMTFENGLDLVQRQAQAMERAGKVVPSGKVEIRLKPATRKRTMCQAAIEHCLSSGIPDAIAICSVTKQTSAHIIEVAGHEEAIRYLENEGPRLFGFRNLRRLVNNQEAFHTEMMRPASDFLRMYIGAKIRENHDYLKEPSSCSVYSATEGARLREKKKIERDLIDYPVKPLKIEQLLHLLFSRPRKVPQPNTLVLWDKGLFRNLAKVNRKAYEFAKLLKA